VLSGTIKKRESIVPETIKKRLESYPGWSDLVRRRKKRHHCQLAVGYVADDKRYFSRFFETLGLQTPLVYVLFLWRPCA